MLSELADFIAARTQWVTDLWIEKIGREPAITASQGLTPVQLTDHLPAICRDLTERVRSAGERRAAREEEHAHVHGEHRWRQGYSMIEVIRESAILRQIVLVDVLGEFAKETPAFDLPNRHEAERLIHRFFTDILVGSAEQHVAESAESLRTSEQTGQAVLDSALDCIIVMGEDGRVREWNAAAEQHFGYTRAEAVGQELGGLIVPPELRERHRQGIAHYLATGEGPVLGKRIEVPAMRADGSRINVELAITPYRVDGKALFTAYVRDITERVRNASRREAQYAIANLISGPAPLTEVGPRILETIASSGDWVFAALWRTSDDGKSMCEATWSAPDSGLGDFERETHGRVFAMGEGLPGRVVATGKPSWLSDIAAEADLPRAVIARASGLHGALFFPLLGANRVQGVIELFTHTVTALDEDLLRLVESLGIQVGLYIERKRTEQELREQKEAAEAANSAKDRFLAALSHELRTPLNPVLMWACDHAEDEDLSPQIKEGLAMICRNIGLEARLIDDLLDLTKIARGKLELNLQPCNADALLHHAIEIVRSQLSGKELRLSVSLSASNHQILADPTRIEQVFWNLLKNAQKFTPEHGEISIRSYEPGPDMVAFEISDNGSGVQPALLDKIFTAFEQGGHKGEGLGLGLAICKAIVDMHGGTLTGANRATGQGAVFTVTLNTSSAAAQGADEETKAPAAWRKLRILIVEDHEATASVMSRLLERAGHEVVMATTVGRAFEIIKTDSFDLLVSDLGLPDGSGYQVMREVAKLGSAKGIAVSGYGMDEDIQRSTDAGFSAHLTKPIDVRELTDAIQRVTAPAVG